MLKLNGNGLNLDWSERIEYKNGKKNKKTVILLKGRFGKGCGRQKKAM